MAQLAITTEQAAALLRIIERDGTTSGGPATADRIIIEPKIEGYANVVGQLQDMMPGTPRRD